ncbi:MAG: DJ-1/PfpI family protein [Lachnospiraceae bacterium]|nr:DJ-1/PfpI family protein [Lachnospiraceae bacterium]
MKNVFVFLATGFEEIEALTPVDILRRAGIDVKLVSITGDEIVTGARGINVKADLLFENIDSDLADILVLPGGMPGTTNLMKYEPLMELIEKYNNNGKNIAAICAAPTIFGKLGLLEGKKATCYPGMEDDLIGAQVCYDSVVTDGNITTSRGMGTALDFSLELLNIFKGEEEAKSMAEKVVKM